jgi:hypothetical protein
MRFCNVSCRRSSSQEPEGVVQAAVVRRLPCTYLLLTCVNHALLRIACCRSSSQEREGVVQAAVSQLVVQLAMAQGNLSRLQLSLDGSRLGGLGLARNGALGFAEVCEYVCLSVTQT